MKLYQFENPIAVMSHVLAVSSSGYYAWLNRKPSVRAQCDAILEITLKRLMRLRAKPTAMSVCMPN